VWWDRADRRGLTALLRRTYASLRAALGDDPVYIAEQLGHRDARFTFRVYQRAAKRRERLIGAHLMAFDRALERAGTSGMTTHEPTASQFTGKSAATDRYWVRRLPVWV
jgi:hypothetical protein